MYILILVVAITNQGVSTSSTRFETRKACVVAGEAIKTKFIALDSDNRVEFVCTPAG